MSRAVNEVQEIYLEFLIYRGSQVCLRTTEEQSNPETPELLNPDLAVVRLVQISRN